ncbi:MAG: DUF4145 domain-containing protein [Maricaulis sp.]|nr:DUF4145 domain-containing protein [Maricaulis sp.]
MSGVFTSSGWCGHAVGFNVSECQHCEGLSLWQHDQLLLPQGASNGLIPNEDLPEKLQADFNEAASILVLSPRGSCALSRLIVENLCEHLGADGGTLDNMIGDLVAKGAPSRVVKMLDVVRVVGNDQVHPGKMVADDDSSTARTILGLINIIAEKLISEPKYIDQQFAALPADKVKGIEQRPKRVAANKEKAARVKSKPKPTVS